MLYAIHNPLPCCTAQSGIYNMQSLSATKHHRHCISPMQPVDAVESVQGEVCVSRHQGHMHQRVAAVDGSQCCVERNGATVVDTTIHKRTSRTNDQRVAHLICRNLDSHHGYNTVGSVNISICETCAVRACESMSSPRKRPLIRTYLQQLSGILIGPDIQNISQGCVAAYGCGYSQYSVRSACKHDTTETMWQSVLHYRVANFDIWAWYNLAANGKNAAGIEPVYNVTMVCSSI